jgi:N-acetylated-alpha-linked acidic dipeptidase
MRLGWIICFAIVITKILSAQSEPEKKTTEDTHVLGYSSQSSQQQKDWEKKFRAGIVPDNIRENMRRLSARPHNVGSPYDKDNAEWILSKFKEYGFDAH